MSKRNLLKQIFGTIICFFVITNSTLAQDEEPASRSINSLDFQAQRSKTASVSAGVGGGPKQVTKVSNAKRRKNIAVVSNAKRQYNLVKRVAVVNPNIKLPVKINGSVKNPVNANAALKNEQLGVTFWRMRPLAAGEDDAPTFPVKIIGKTENWTAERIGSATEFQKGDRVRFTIESSRSGYLYIVNREFYTDGSKGDAEIIYPTLRTRGGDNRVAAGSLVEIPPASDSFPYFNVNPRKANYAGEELVVVISPVKFEDIELALKAQGINREKLEKWLADWAATVDIYDAEDGEGVALTASETESVNSRALTQEEPLPQTIYKVKTRADLPLVVPFQMQARTP